MVRRSLIFRAVYLYAIITIGVQSSLGAVVFHPVPLKEYSSQKKSAKEFHLEYKLNQLHEILNTGNYPKCVRKLIEIRDFIKRYWHISIDIHKVIDKCFQIVHEANLERIKKRRQMEKEREELEKIFGYSNTEYTEPYKHLHEIEDILEGIDVDGLTTQMHRVLDREEEFFAHEEHYRKECREKNIKFSLSEYNAVFMREYGSSQDEMDNEIRKQTNVDSELELIITFGCAASFLAFVTPFLPEMAFISYMVYTFASSAVVMLITYVNSPKKDEK